MADVNAEGPKKVEAENNNQTAPASPKPGPVVDQAQGEDRRTVFVKGIPQNYNEDQLCALFQAFGVVESSRIMVDQQTSQILDKGFVTFKTQQEAQAAVENLDGHKVADKTITCKISSQRNQSPLRISQGNNLYIRNLSPSVTDHDLKQMFHSFGNVLKCKVICDKQTGVSRQIGLVLFERREDAVSALEQMNGKKVDETSGPLAIQFAETETQRNARKTRNGAPSSPSFVPISPPVLMPGLMSVDMYPVSPPMGYFYDPYYPEPVFQPIPAPPGAYYGPGGAGPFLIPHPHAHPHAHPIPHPHPHPHAHPHPLPLPHAHHPHPSDHGPESSNQASSTEGAVVPVHHTHPHPQPIPYQPMPQPIAFSSHPIPFPRPRSSSYDAMAEYYQNHSPMGSPVFLSPMGSPIQHHVFPILPPMHPQATPGSPGHPTEHPPSSPARSRFSHQQNENTNLFVFHLPSNIDDDGLRVMFEKFGKLESVRVITDKESSESRGYGFVKFANAEDAQVAIKQMNGMQVGNKHLKVSLKTPTPSSSPRLQRYSTGSNGASPPPHSPSSSPGSSPHSSPGPSPILPRRSSAPIAPQIHRTHT